MYISKVAYIMAKFNDVMETVEANNIPHMVADMEGDTEVYVDITTNEYLDHLKILLDNGLINKEEFLSILEEKCDTIIFF